MMKSTVFYSSQKFDLTMCFMYSAILTEMPMEIET